MIEGIIEIITEVIPIVKIMNRYFLSIMGSYVDHYYKTNTFPEEGDFVHAEFICHFAGGCPLNVAAIAAAKGIEVKALDMLGEKEETTQFLLDEMKRLHIDTSHIQIARDVTNGKVLIFLTGDNRTMFLLDPKRPYYDVDHKMQDLLNGAGYIYTLMHMINRSFSCIDPLLEAKRNGARIILDGSSLYDDPSRTKILYALCDGLFINEKSYERLVQASEKDPKELFFESGGEFIAVTEGSRGSTLYLKDGTIFKPSLKNVEILDSTGAGDAFAGCFIAALMSGYSYEKALSLASVNGAYACTVFGGLGGVADFDTLFAFAKEHDYEL